MNERFSRRMQFLTASEVREILKVTERPEILSFAGGLPAPELFPSEELAKHAQALLMEEGPKALQYAATEGYTPLRKWIAGRLNSHWGMHVDVPNVMITSGSQSGLDLVAKLFLDKDDLVWCEVPTYLAALASFRVFQPRFEEMPTNDDGVILEGLEERILKNKPKMVYVIPTFQNPSGRTWPMWLRKGFMELMTRYDITVIEDNAYYEVCFDDIEYCSLSAFDPKGLVVSLASFSKVLCPGLRVAWISAAPEVIDKLVVLKQSTDLQTPTFNQMLVHRFLMANDFEERIKLIRDTYRARRDAMLAELAESLPEGCKYTHPGGGMFVWVEMPENVSAHKLLQRCLKSFVAVVPGSSFYPTYVKENTCRLNFSNLPPDTVRHGVRVFCNALREEIAEVNALEQ